jgi:ClpX C4-type zinc finger
MPDAVTTARDRYDPNRGLLSRYTRRMALDAGLLREAREAASRVRYAEHRVAVARADFHRAVCDLQLTGASLRAIADALGLSHQRVHQIVEAAGGSGRSRRASSRAADLLSCSFCGRDQDHTSALVAGPGVYICGRCLETAAKVVTGTAPGHAPGGFGRVSADADAAQCSFCGKRRSDTPAMAYAGGARICSECMALCREIFTERLT